MKLSRIAAAATLAVLGGSAMAAPTFADVVTIMDESGSMSGEQTWSAGMITALETGLLGAGLTGGNNYGLVGFGNGLGAGQNNGRQINVGAGQFGTAAQYATATGSLVISGSVEDGYGGINFANGYTYRAGAAKNYILVTDEDRDNQNAALTYATILSSMTSQRALLNAVLNVTFRCGAVTTGILGIDSKGNGYQANGSGGFTTLAGCTANTGFGTSIADYANLALATGGAAWDLNLLRAGGLTATSFTAAFIAIKIQEIVNQTPEPATLALVGAALLGVGAARRRKAA